MPACNNAARRRRRNMRRSASVFRKNPRHPLNRASTRNSRQRSSRLRSLECRNAQSPRPPHPLRQVDKRRAFSTIKVYLADITACHVGCGGLTASQHPLVCRFMRVLLLALASAMCVSDIYELSLHPSCTQFFSGDVKIILKPNPAFVPKVVGLGSPINLAAFTASPEEQWSHALCPVRAVRT